MRTRSVNPRRAVQAERGMTSARRAGGNLRIKDASGNDIVVSTLVVPSVLELDDEEGQIELAGIGSVGDGTTSVDDVTGIVVPPGGFTDNGDGTITLNFLTNRLGEQPDASIVTDAGSATTLDLSTANWFDVTLTEACTLSFSNPPDETGEWGIGLRGEFDVTWPASVVWRDTDGSETATPPDMPGEFNHVVITTLDGGTTYGATLDNGSGGVITEGAIETAGHYEVLMTGASPAEPLENGSGTDWLYVWVP